MNLDDTLRADLQRIEQQSLYRIRKLTDGPQRIHMRVDGQSLVNFCSNDYLGLASHPEVARALKRGVDKYGVGSGAAHLVSGHSCAHHQLEEALAEYTGRSRALLFSTGYMANLGIVNALLNKGDIVYQDKLNHASLIDAALFTSSFSACKFKRYAHNDIKQLTQLLSAQQATGGQLRKLVMSDAVFSMDGDQALLPAMSELCQQQQAWLMIDDAHGFGVLGESGAGSAEAFSLSQQQLPIYMATLGKAMGVFGAFVAGSDALIETLIQKARAYMFTTAMPAAMAQALLSSIEISRTETWRREKLQHLIRRFRLGAEQIGLSLMDSQTAIQPILVGDNARALELSQQLQQRGFWLTPIRPPTVPKGTARLRLTLSALHQEADVDALLEALADIMPSQEC